MEHEALEPAFKVRAFKLDKSFTDYDLFTWEQVLERTAILRTERQAHKIDYYDISRIEFVPLVTEVAPTQS